MITFPGYLLLGAFGIVFMILLIMISVQIYHGFRFGKHDRLTMVINMAFVSVVAGLVVLTAIFLLPIDWSEGFSITPPTEIPSLELPNEPDGFLLNQ